MPRPMLKKPQSQAQPQTQSQTQTNNILSASYTRKTQNPEQKQMDKMKLEKLLRKPRSKKYMEALQKLDAGGHVHNQNKVNDIINTIRQEFPEVELSGILLGYVSICYLGRPYEVHTLDFSGGIIEHYKTGQAMPGDLEKARTIAMRGGYAFIEVYIDCCRAVSANGTVAVIPC